MPVSHVMTTKMLGEKRGGIAGTATPQDKIVKHYVTRIVTTGVL